MRYAASPPTRPGPRAALSTLCWTVATSTSTHLTVTSCDADTLFHTRYFERPHLPLRDRPDALPALLAGADLLLQQHLAGARAAACAQRTGRTCPPQPVEPPPQGAVLAVDLHPLDADGARRRLLGRRHHPGRLAHVPQVLLPPPGHGRGAADPPATGQRRRSLPHGQGDVHQPVPAGAPLGLGRNRRAVHRAGRMFRRGDVPLRKRFLRFWYFFENHLAWSTQWFFITLGGSVALGVRPAHGHDDPAGLGGPR